LGIGYFPEFNLGFELSPSQPHGFAFHLRAKEPENAKSDWEAIPSNSKAMAPCKYEKYVDCQREGNIF
jgi:hypothetical protein